MIKLDPVTHTGLRAQLIPLQSEHAEALYSAGRDPRIWQYMPSLIRSQDDMRAWVEEALAERERGTAFPFTVVDRETDRIAGSTRFLDFDPRNRSIEIGHTWYSPEVWRTRINTECKYLLFCHCFETLDLIRVQLKTDARNAQSQQAIERIGGVREGALRHHRIMPDGYLRDSVYFSVLAEEWPQIRTRLEQFLARIV